MIRQDGHHEVRRRFACGGGGGGSVYGIDDGDGDGVNGIYDGDDDGDGDDVAQIGGWLGKSSCNTCRPKSQPRPGQMSKLQNV